MERWDAAVSADATTLPYGFSWWLDAVTDHSWYGLVLDDYRVVLPLAVHRSFLGLLQVGRAPFTQQGGPWGAIEEGDLKYLLTSLPQRVINLNFPLRAGIDRTEIPGEMRLRERTNLLLDLSSPLHDIRQGYGKTLRKKLRRSGPAELLPTDEHTVVEIYRQHSGGRAGLQEKHYAAIHRLIAAATERRLGNLYGAYAGGELLAAGFFPDYRGRTINLFAGSTALGYQENGMARLLDAVIAEHRGPGRTLDFEGSDIDGVREFFSAFSPTHANYLQIIRRFSMRQRGHLER